MPFVARLFVKTGIVYLGLTFAVGGVLLTLQALGHAAPFIITVEHGHMGFVGWLVNTVVGIALWLLPLNRAAFPSTQGRYPERLAIAAFALLNAGLAIRLFFEPLATFHPSAIATGLLVVSAVAQVAGVAIVAWIAWKRIYAPPLRPQV